MSRSGYSDDLEPWDLIRWRGAVASAMRGKRGQAFLREMQAALSLLSEPKLIANELEASGEVCALGALGKLRGLNMDGVDVEDSDSVAALFGIPRTLACEIVYENDEGGRYNETNEQRFYRMRQWINSQVQP